MNRRDTGTRYEQLAAAYLKENGFRILAMNYRCRTGEVDIIALEKAVLCFVEVKYRANDRAGSPFEAVDFRKQKKIAAVCDHYRITHPNTQELQIRFDVVGILGDEVTLIRNAFPYPERY